MSSEADRDRDAAQQRSDEGAFSEAASSDDEAAPPEDGASRQGDPEAESDEPEPGSALERTWEDERAELVTDLQRVQADFENFRKRMVKEQTAHVERATEALVVDLLPVLDSFELAVLNVPERELDDASAKLRKGVDLVYAELLSVLEKAGLSRVESLGKPFDPQEHEAVLRDPGEGDPVVLEELRSGYRLKGRVIRAAMVRVGPRAGDDPPPESGEA